MCFKFIFSTLLTSTDINQLLLLHTYLVEGGQRCIRSPAISFSIYAVNLKCGLFIAFSKIRQCMTSSCPSREKCVTYVLETLGQRHMIRLAAVTINFIWQGLSLIQVSTSYHKSQYCSLPVLSYNSQIKKKIEKFAYNWPCSNFFCVCMCFLFSMFVGLLCKPFHKL